MGKRCYLGCDVHEKSTTVCLAWEEAGTIKRRDLGVVASTEAALQEAAAGWAAAWGTRLGELWPPVPVLETGGRSMLVHDALVPLADEVWVVDAAEVARLRGHRPKNDKEDAFLLAKLAAQGLVQPLWRPSLEVLGLRAVVRVRRGMVQRQTALANQLRALAQLGGNPIERGKTLSRANLGRLKEATWKTRDFAAAVELLVKEAEDLADALGLANAHLQERFVESQYAQWLDTLPRCGVVNSLELATEIGDIRRFRSAEALRSFAGLTPGHGESGGRRIGGGLSKHGNRHLRYAFMTLANQMSFLSADEEELAALYWRRFNQRRGMKGAGLRAQALVASRLCDIVYAMLRQGRGYEPRLAELQAGRAA
jgi:transposase